MKRTLALLTALAFVFAAGPAQAKPCRDAHGKFVKCPVTKQVAKKQCRDSHGKFVKCPV